MVASRWQNTRCDGEIFDLNGNDSGKKNRVENCESRPGEALVQPPANANAHGANGQLAAKNLLPQQVGGILSSIIAQPLALFILILSALQVQRGQRPYDTVMYERG